MSTCEEIHSEKISPTVSYVQLLLLLCDATCGHDTISCLTTSWDLFDCNELVEEKKHLWITAATLVPF